MRLEEQREIRCRRTRERLRVETNHELGKVHADSRKRVTRRRQSKSRRRVIVKREGKGLENGELRGGRKKDQRPDRRDQTRRSSRLGQQGRVSVGNGPSALWNLRTRPEAKEANEGTVPSAAAPVGVSIPTSQHACGLRLCPQSGRGEVGLAVRVRE